MLSNIINSARGYHPVATGDMEVANTHIINLPLRQGDYKHNKNILDYILSAPAQKKSHLKEVFRKEGVNFAIDAIVASGVTAATYFVTTALLAKTPEIMQMMVENDNPSFIQQKVSAYLNDPHSQKELASFMVKAQVVAGIGSTLVLTQAFSRAFGDLGKSVGELLKALTHPQEGQEHEAKIKLLAFRKIAEKVTVAIRDLPPHIQEKAEEALEDLKGEIHRMSSTAFARDANDVKKAADKLFLYFALPLEVEDTYQLGINGNKDLAAQFNKDQTELAKSFDEPLCTQLEYIMILHRYSTINQSVLPINVWLEGPTAVGKTYFVENMAKIFHDTLRKMTIYQYLEMRGQPVDRKQSSIKWSTPNLEALGPWKNMVETAKTLNAVNLMDEMKFFDSGDKENNLDAVEPMKKARNPTNIPEIPRLGVKLHAVEINFYNSNYPMELPLPDEKKDPQAYAITKVAHEAFIKSFIHIKFKNWSPEKLKERLDEKVTACLNAMVSIHAPAVVSATKAIFEELKPIILEQAAIHNPSEPETKITLKELEKVVNKIGTSCALSFDAVFNRQKAQQGGRQASSSRSDEITLSEEKKQELIKTITDDFNMAAKKVEVNEKQKGKQKPDSETKSQEMLASKQVIPEKTDDEIIAEMREKIEEIKAMALAAPTREEMEDRIKAHDAEQQQKMERFLSDAVKSASAPEGQTTSNIS